MDLGRLLLLYLLIILLPRVLKAIMGGKKGAPQKQQRRWMPVPQPELYEEEEEELDYREVFGKESRPAFPVIAEVDPEDRYKKDSTANQQEMYTSGKRISKRRTVVKVPVERTIRIKSGAGGRFHFNEWANGVVMAEALGPPRAKRPWYPR